MSDAIFQVPVPQNEPPLEYAPGTPDREDLKASIRRLTAQQAEIPLIIGGREVLTGDTGPSVTPHNHAHVLGTYHKAGVKQVREAIEAASDAWQDWSRMPWESRAAIFLKAAEILTCQQRSALNAAAMLDLSKTAHQSEIDVISELADYAVRPGESEDGGRDTGELLRYPNAVARYCNDWRAGGAHGGYQSVRSDRT